MAVPAPQFREQLLMRMDVLSTDRFRPNGLKENGMWVIIRGIFCRGEKSFALILTPQQNNQRSWQITAWRSLATICSYASPHTESGMAQPANLLRPWALVADVQPLRGWCFLGRCVSTDRFRPNGLKEKGEHRIVAKHRMAQEVVQQILLSHSCAVTAPRI